jgi:KDO2-lipid IV(A) lauroyltransferase
LTRIVRPGVSAKALAFFFKGLLRVVPIRRKVAMRNLEIALHDRTPEERRRILRKTYDHLVWLGIEFAALQRDPSQVLEWMDVANPEALDDSAGGILLACHVGNWELAASWVAQAGHRITAIARDSNDSGERTAINSLRNGAGVNLIASTSSMTRALGILRRNEFLAVMPDQHGFGSGAKAPLFGIDTPTSEGVSVFAYLTKKPIIPVYTHRIAPFRHVMRFGGPIAWTDEGCRDKTVHGITCAVNREIERIIRESPDQWLAQHRRFRGQYGEGGARVRT